MTRPLRLVHLTDRFTEPRPPRWVAVVCVVVIVLVASALLLTLGTAIDWALVTWNQVAR